MNCPIHGKPLTCLSCRAATAGKARATSGPRKMRNKRIERIMKENGCSRQWAYELLKKQRPKDKLKAPKAPKGFSTKHHALLDEY